MISPSPPSFLPGCAGLQFELWLSGKTGGSILEKLVSAEDGQNVRAAKVTFEQLAKRLRPMELLALRALLDEVLASDAKGDHTRALGLIEAFRAAIRPVGRASAADVVIATNGKAQGLAVPEDQLA
jgi:hypothetical protein